MLFKSLEGKVVTIQFKDPVPLLGVFSPATIDLGGESISQFLMASPEDCLEPPRKPVRDARVIYNALFMYEVANDNEERALFLAETPMLHVTYRPWLTRAVMHEGQFKTFTGPLCTISVREESVQYVLTVADGPPEEEMRLLVAIREEAKSADGRPKIIL